MQVDPETLKGLIVEEIDNKLRPFNARLKWMVREIKAISIWKNETYGNGSGRTGYLERARAEDEKWKQEIRAIVNALSHQVQTLTHERLEAEIEARLLKKQAVLKESQSKKRMGRMKVVIEILSVLASGGAFGWILHVLHPH